MSFSDNESQTTGYQNTTSLADFLTEENELKAREAAFQASKIATVKPRPKQVVPVAAIKLENEDVPLPPPAPEIDFGTINWVGKLIGTTNKFLPMSYCCAAVLSIY